MTDSFDPYFEWLGIQSGSQPPNHYRLLGLQSYESDPESIGRAADSAMAKVRRVRPGANVATWSQMLDRLSTAKNCLLDPSSKRAYDESLANGRPVEPSQLVRNVSCGLGDLPLPRFESIAVEECPPNPFPAEYDEPPLSESVETDDWAPATIEESSSISPIVVQPAPITRMTAKSSRIGPFVALLTALAVGLAGLFVYWMLQGDPPANKDRLAADKPAAVALGPAETAKPQAEIVQPEEAAAEEQKPGKATKEVEKPKPETKEPEPTRMEVVEMTAEEIEAEKLEAEKLRAEAEESKAKSPALDAEAKAAAFADAVRNVRVALAGRDLATADKYLKTASDNAQTQEDRDQIGRLQTMIDNLTQFWDGIRTSMAKFEAADEILLKTTRLSVVESGRDYLLIRVEGRNHRFEVPTLPTSLVMLLVEQNFGKDPGSRAVIGTFLAVDPKGDRELARQYLEEAAKAGIDSKKLLSELDAFGLGTGEATETESPSDTAAGDILERKVFALEEALKTTRNQAGRVDIAQKALTLIGQAVEQQQIDLAERLATVAAEAARRAKNTPLLRQATTMSKQIQAMQKKESTQE